MASTRQNWLDSVRTWQANWNDEQWWVAVDIDQKRERKKHFAEVVSLIERGTEHYRMHLEDGRHVIRGIFRDNPNLNALELLVGTAGGWEGTRIYVRGNPIEGVEIDQLEKVLHCANRWHYCRVSGNGRRNEFLGCHIMQIGLLGYSLEAFAAGTRYWFSFYYPYKEKCFQFYLRRQELRATTVFSKFCCPEFPPATDDIIDRLPDLVDLDRSPDKYVWLLTSYRLKARQASGYLPPIMPRSEEKYRTWLWRILKKG